MALDGAFLHLLVKELECILETRIDKIYQPLRDELIFVLRKSGFHKRLFVSLKPGRARIGLTEERPDNPAQAPMFCMLLRKHLTGARIIQITQPNLERLVYIKLSAFNEMGDETQFILIIELISNQANLILTDKNLKIIDSVKRSDIESGKRLIQPGAVYTPPAAQDKINPLNITQQQFLNEVKKHDDFPVHKVILNQFDGISPLIARELCELAGVGDMCVNSLTEENFSQLGNSFSFLTGILNSQGVPSFVLKNGVPLDFSFIPITQYGNLCEGKTAESLSGLLDEFYGELDLADRLRNHSAQTERIVKNAIARIARKLQLRSADLKKCENREQLRIYGELIKANLHKIRQGDTTARVENYYDEDLNLINIPLNPTMSPAQNAAKYFKEYKKTYSTSQHLTALIEEDNAELAYLETVMEALSRVQSIADINEIKEELIAGGYIKSNEKGKKEKPSSKFTEYKSVEGYRILVGRNNRQNDLITLKLAEKNDVWFHTKNIPGSHVVVFSGGKDLSEQTLMLAANLAAYNSKAKNSASVPVDYTPVKNIKKPVGAKPGMVIYSTNKTLYVTPEKIF